MKLKKYLISLFFLPLGFLLSAQQDVLEGWTYIQIDSTKQKWGDWDQPDWLRYFGLDAGDVDNDGNLDIISGRYVYHNPGGDMEESWKRTVLDDNVDAILYVNVDNDPYADIIAMALPNLYWYEATNTEGTRYKRRLIGQIPATSHVNSQGFEKAELISTGRSEFVIAGDGDIYAISITETNAENVEWKVQMICENTSDEGIGVGDIDGDGDLDIAAGRRPEGEGEPKILVWYENPGHIDGLWKDVVVGKSEHPIDRIEIADVDGDNKTDIIVTEERYPGEEPDANFWWFGQKTLATWERNRITTQYSINNLDITDFDADGDIDLLTAEHKGQALELQLWKNDGKGNFSKTIIDTGKENHLGTQFMDLDNDGDLDIIGAGWDQHKYMHVWRNDAIKSLKSGMLFKEYPWVPHRVSDSGKFLRVGGKLDYTINGDHFPKRGHKKGRIPLGHKVDLENAIGAEVLVERVQSHEDTKNLRIQFNGGNPIQLPEPKTIPHPATDYMFHTNVRVPLPLSDLKQGGNSFKLTVDKEQSWDWPQNLVYGIVLRIYYTTDEKRNPIANISGLASGDMLGNTVTLSLTGDRLPEIASVDYIGHYEDVNVQGDEKYRQWQYRYHRGKREYHIGSSSATPFQVVWDTQWIPDQNNPIAITALVTDKQGKTHVLPLIEDLTLQRDHSVQMVKPYARQPFWTTRGGEHTQYLDIPFEVLESDKAQLYWNSWSPCYSVGIDINGTKQDPDGSAPCYDAHWHMEVVKNINAFKKGKNELTTLKTPLHDGQMVHGMDVQWPGIMLKIKRESPQDYPIQIVEGSYEKRPHFIVQTGTATYYLDIAGGGFSRIIDNYGNDWVGYKTEPWGKYPASAASAFRGLPNLVFKSEIDGGAGHPGHDKCISEIVSGNKIRSTAISGEWEWEWTFFKDHVKLEVLKTEAEIPYWFLYEGTPGGSFSPKMSSYGTDISGPLDNIPDFYKGDIDFRNFQWAYFNNKDVNATFFVGQVSADDNMDMMSYLGNTERGANSKDGMTVFGFGRGPNTEPLLKGKNTFILGMTNYRIIDEKNHLRISKHIQTLIERYNQKI